MFDFATPRPIYACSTHLTPGDDIVGVRLVQTSTIKQIITPFISAGRTVFIGADLNDTPESPALNPLWDPRYGMGSDGPFVDVDSGPSQERNTTCAAAGSSRSASPTGASAHSSG